MRPRPLRNHSACSRYTYTLSSASSENMNASRHRAAMKRCILSQYRMIDVSSNAYIVLTVQSRMTCPSKQLFTFFHPFNLIGRTHTSRLEPVKLGGLAAAVLPLAFPTRLDSFAHSHHLTYHTLTNTFIHSLTLSLPQTATSHSFEEHLLYFPFKKPHFPTLSIPFYAQKQTTQTTQTPQENQQHVRKGHHLRHFGRRRARRSRNSSGMPSRCRQVRCASHT